MNTPIPVKLLIIVLLLLSHQAHANYQQNFLTESILNTPFTALVSATQVSKLNSPHNDVDIYVVNAKVHESISGKMRETISYKMTVELGENVILNSAPVIISLCEENGEFYWPGVGAEMPVNAQLLALAHRVATKKLTLNMTENKSHCE